MLASYEIKSPSFNINVTDLTSGPLTVSHCCGSSSASTWIGLVTSGSFHVFLIWKASFASWSFADYSGCLFRTLCHSLSHFDNDLISLPLPRYRNRIWAAEGPTLTVRYAQHKPLLSFESKYTIQIFLISSGIWWICRKKGHLKIRQQFDTNTPANKHIFQCVYMCMTKEISTMLKVKIKSAKML